MSTKNLQQTDQLRSTSLTLLTRTEDLIKSWKKNLSASNSILASLSNITRQRTVARQHVPLVTHHYVDPDRLAYNQALALEDTLAQLHKIFDSLTAIVSDIQKLEKEADKHLCKAATLRSPPSSVPPPLSSDTLIQVSAIQPHDVHRFLSELSYMYTQELHYKRTLLDDLSIYASTSDSLDELQQLWLSQNHIHPEIQDEMSERIALFKQVKKVVSSTDY